MNYVWTVFDTEDNALTIYTSLGEALKKLYRLLEGIKWKYLEEDSYEGYKVYEYELQNNTYYIYVMRASVDTGRAIYMY